METDVFDIESYKNDFTLEKKKWIIQQMKKLKKDMLINRTAMLLFRDKQKKQKSFEKVLRNSAIYRLKHEASLDYFIKNQIPIIVVDSNECLDMLIEKIRNPKMNVAQKINDIQNYQCHLIQINDDLTRINGFNDVQFVWALKYFFLDASDINLADPDPHLIFCDTKISEPRDYRIKHYIFQNSYGDLMLLMPLLYMVQQIARSQKRKIIFYLKDDKQAEILRYFIPNANIKIWKQPLLSQQNNLTKLQQLRKDICYIDITDTILDNRNEDSILLNDMCKKEVFNLKGDAQNYIDKLKKSLKAYPKDFQFLHHKYKYVIAMQRLSDTRTAEGCPVKELSLKVIQKFIVTCTQHDIAVINLEPGEAHTGLYTADYSSWGFQKIFNLLQNVDLFIGVDSCFGHACALLNVPSITCLVTNASWYKMTCRWYIPITSNLTLIPKNFEKERITSDVLFNMAQKILSGEITLSEKLLSYSHNKNIFYVDGDKIETRTVNQDSKIFN